MKKNSILALILALGMMLSVAGCGSASSSADSTGTTGPTSDSTTTTVNWPTQPVNIMCPAAAGGGTDIILRTINEYFTKTTGQPFVITNMTGLTGYEQIYQGSTDGYDFICGTTTIFTSKADGTLTYDWADYDMVAFVEGGYNLCIAVQADSPYETINDLLDAAKADPTSITGGITLSGQPYMFAKALKAAVGIDLYYVDCGTTSERNASLLGGQVDYIITNLTASQAYVDSGDFRFIAIDGEERSQLSPETPTFIEQGVDFCFVPQPMVWLAPKGTPVEICEAFNATLNEIYTDPNFAEDYLKLMQVAQPLPNVEESIQAGQAFADALAPYVK